MKSNLYVSSYFLHLTYFSLGLAVCTLCLNHALLPVKQEVAEIEKITDGRFIAQLINHDEEAVLTHFLQ